ncbi:T-complex protein 1 subunit delta [Fasciola hepatica]|uniref:T-complex protein 1 subunit delta n=1 Tax=Fasciola hepatica TaxID=6192 RepID=A0A4E0RYD8_FASHE|nr:T-complex protein 1 subunit delta [Fasciola hepatica]
MTPSAQSASKASSFGPSGRKERQYEERSKPAAIRTSNIVAAKAVADAIRTSLGPKGMDKMIQEPKGDVTITNDGATILKQMKLLHPAAKMLVELSKAQDIETGDGTTTVVVIAGSLLDACSKLLDKGIHPTTISDAFQKAAKKACEIIDSMSIPIELSSLEQLTKVATTSLNSKVVSQHSGSLAPIAVKAVLDVVDPDSPHSVTLDDIRVVKKLGGTVEDTELVDGLILTQRVTPGCTVKRVEKAKIGLIQFCVSPPKTDMENNVIVTDYTQMDRILKEERQYILNIVKAVKKAGCNVLLIQKSILRDSVNELALHYFSKMNIMVVRDIERTEVEFICKTLNCIPIASLDHFSAEYLGFANLVEESEATARCVRITGIQNKGRTVSILVRGSNKLMLDEAERSLHDALCVIRCLVKKGAMIAGGGAPEIEIAQKLAMMANATPGLDQYCFRAFADAFEVIPYTLAENAGLNPIQTVTELRALHARGERNSGINVRAGAVSDILSYDVMQPTLVSYSAVTLASETVRSILKIDDVINAVRA